ncbi:MAG: TolC family protein [Gammaproteobacteria bacterium]|nr:TolC family protein [Gammaproteobacteria bacterium]
MIKPRPGQRPGRLHAVLTWRLPSWLALMPAIALAGCAATTTAQDPHPANTWLKERVPDAPSLPWPGASDASAPAMASPAHPSPGTTSFTLPNGPLGQDQSVALSLQRSPSLAALLARSEAQAARERSQARPGFIGFSIERLTQGDEVEIGRTWSLGLFDLLSWPWRHQAAERRIDAEQQRLARQVLQHVQNVRAQWVQAVAAQQRLAYQADVLRAGTTAGELARRMQQAGHFSAAQTARHEANEVEARLAQAQAQRQALAAREALVRLLGLNREEAARLQLPDRLPPVPEASAWTPQSVEEAARQRRLDVRLAEARWQAAQGDRRDGTFRSVIDLEAAYRRDTSNEAPVKQGPELGIRLVSIDFGAARRQATRLDEQAALAEWQQASLHAESQLRERFADHQATLATAQQAAKVLGPVRKRLLDERLKQYNGMLIGPFELIDEARAHVAAVLTALDAQRDFWLADAALVAAIDGLDGPDAGANRSSSNAPTNTEASH